MIRREVLPNGTRLVVRELHAAPVVALNLWVGTGARDDPDGLGGLSHAVEHMLFKGPSGSAGDRLTRVVQGAGGTLNALTGCDHTTYYQILPSSGWHDALAAQCEAVARPAFGERGLAEERRVIVDEARASEAAPSTFVWKRLLETACRGHPCGRPIVGTAESVSRIGVKDLERHVDLHYRSDNVVQVIVGDVDTDEAVAAARSCLAAIPEGGRPAPFSADRCGQRALRGRAFTGPVGRAYLGVAFHVPGVLHDDTPALDLVSGILGLGRSSRLHSSLSVRRGLATAIGASIAAYRDTGLLVVRAALNGGDPIPAIQEIFRQIAGLRAAPPTGEEMRKSLRRLEAGYVLEHETAGSLASALGLFETLGDVGRADEYVDRLAAVTREDALRVARGYLGAGNATIVAYVPSDGGTEPGDRSGEFGEAADGAFSRSERAPVDVPGDGWRESGAAYTRPMILSERSAVARSHLRLPNGVPVFVRATSALPVVSVVVGIRGGHVEEPDGRFGLTHFTQQLMQRGTVRRSAERVADDLEGLGTALAAGIDRDGLGFGTTVLGKHLDEALEILSEVLLEPGLPEEHVERVRRAALADIAAIADHPVRHARELLLPMLFPAHPYGRRLQGLPETVARMRADDASRWHARLMTTGRAAIAVCGDTTGEAVLSKLERGLGGLTAGEAPVPAGGIAAGRFGGRVERDLEAYGQSCVAVGVPGAAAGTRDAITLRVIATGLSMMGGRLWISLRERPPHAYGVSASSISLKSAGALVALAMVAPGEEERTVVAIERELEEVAADGFGEGELDRAKQSFAGGFEIGLERSSARAAVYATALTLGLGPERIDAIPCEARALNVDDVRRAGSTYLNPRRRRAVVVLRGRSR